MSGLKPGPGILDIAPYKGGESAVAGIANPVKLSSNESPLGPSPVARKAFIDAAASLSRYPDGSWRALREAIALRHGLDPAHIVCGNGSDEILSLLGQIYLQPDDEVIYSEHGFLLYKIIAMASGARPIAVSETDLTGDVDAILAAVNERTRIVFIANPNNPTGTFIPEQDIRRLHAGLPGRVLLVLDAAYAEYVRRNDYESGIGLVAGADNIVMTRTFSKIYGLASLRLGWALAPPSVVDAIGRVRGPFNVNGPAIAAGAAAIADIAFEEKAVEHNATWRGWLESALSELGLTVTPSVGNFVLIHFPEDDKTAAAADQFLQQRGLILRRVKAYGLPNALRMTVGLEPDNRAVIAALGEFLEQ